MFTNLKCRQNAALTGTKALGELNREPSSIFWFQSHMPRIACSHWLEIIPKTFPLTAHMHKTCNTMSTHTRISTNSNQNNKRKKSKQLQPTPSTEEGFCEEFFFFFDVLPLTNNGKKLFTSYMACCHSNRQGNPGTKDHVIKILKIAPKIGICLRPL